MAKQIYTSIEEEISELKKERNAIILAHNYQIGQIQDIADFTGDSLALARFAARSDASVIVFCGVTFMAETASILCPDKKVIIPDVEAGCSLAAGITADQVRAWKKMNPEGLVVCYVNSTADVKAESDYCCTSSNALEVVNSIPKDKKIFFIPDFYLGTYVKSKTKRENIDVWIGRCHVHYRIDPKDIENLKFDHPQAEFLMHPECGCLTKSMKYADQILSTGGMLTYAKESDSKEFIIATEEGLIHQLKNDSPNKKFYLANEKAICEYMKLNDLEKIVNSLENLTHEIKVPFELAQKAILPLERMLQIG